VIEAVPVAGVYFPGEIHQTELIVGGLLIQCGARTGQKGEGIATRQNRGVMGGKLESTRILLEHQAQIRRVIVGGRSRQLALQTVIRQCAPHSEYLAPGI
jgi:hypothetical protein